MVAVYVSLMLLFGVAAYLLLLIKSVWTSSCRPGVFIYPGQGVKGKNPTMQISHDKWPMISHETQCLQGKTHFVTEDQDRRSLTWKFTGEVWVGRVSVRNKNTFWQLLKNQEFLHLIFLINSLKKVKLFRFSQWKLLILYKYLNQLTSMIISLSQILPTICLHKNRSLWLKWISVSCVSENQWHELSRLSIDNWSCYMCALWVCPMPGPNAVKF